MVARNHDDADSGPAARRDGVGHFAVRGSIMAMSPRNVSPCSMLSASNSSRLLHLAHRHGQHSICLLGEGLPLRQDFFAFVRCQVRGR